jgi:hypothetical protein
MAANRPNTRELVEAVREFIENKVQPDIQGKTAFHTRIAINALKIVERELKQGPELNRREETRLKKILGQEGTLEELNKKLCKGLRKGEIDHRDPDLLEHLRLTSLGKLSVDNPNYSAYKKAVDEGYIEPE